MTSIEQLIKWVKGNPIHNNTKDECCPDFSCCKGKAFMAPLKARERFAKAVFENDKDTQNQMLMMFLGNAMAGYNIYFAGENPDNNSLKPT